MMFAKLKYWIMGAVLAASVVIGAFFSGSAIKEAEGKADAAKRTAEGLRKVRKIEKDAAAMPINDVRERIAGRLRD